MLKRYFNLGNQDQQVADLADKDILEDGTTYESQTFLDKLLRRRRTLVEPKDKKRKEPNLRTKLALRRTLGSELRDQGIQGVDAKLLRELGEDNVEQSIIGEEIAKLSEEYDLRAITWRQRMVHFLHTMPVEIFMIFLVVLDVFIILAMFVLDMYVSEEQLVLANLKGTELLQYFNHSWPNVSSQVLQYDKIDYAYKAMVNLQYSAHSDAAGAHTIHKRAASSGDKPSPSAYLEEHLYKSATMIYNSQTTNYILHFCSIAILSVFVIEVILKIIGYGKKYFKNKWEVVDGVVILISFSLDVAVTNQNFSHQLGKTVLIVLLIWRVIRILNAMVLTSRARTMFRLRVLRKSKRIAEDKNKQLTSDITDLKTEVTRLRNIARGYGAGDHEIVSAEVLSKSSVSTTKAGLKNMMAQLLNLNAKIATVSCSSLNQLKPTNGYSRGRRPSMIGDETMCHDAKLASEFSELRPKEHQPMRQRAASDAGGITRFSRKLRHDMNELKHKKEGSGGITQEDCESASDVAFYVYENENGGSAQAASVEQSYTVIDEAAAAKQLTSEPNNETNGSAMIELAQVHVEEKNNDNSPDGHTNPAFTCDDLCPNHEGRGNGDSDSSKSSASGDSGYSQSNTADDDTQLTKNEASALENPTNSLQIQPTNNNKKFSDATPVTSEVPHMENIADGSPKPLPDSPPSPETSRDQANKTFLLPQISVTCADNQTTEAVF